MRIDFANCNVYLEWERAMKKETRQYLRSLVNWPVTIKASNGDIEGETRDIGVGGAFIYCQEPLETNQIFCLSIHIHPGIASFTSMAETVWLAPDGMGVRFHSDLPEHGQLLSEFISDASRLKACAGKGKSRISSLSP